MINIRKILPSDDRLEISNIYEQAWKKAYKGIVPQDFLDSLEKGSWASKVDRPGWNTLVVELDGKLIGTSSYSKSRFEEYSDAGEIISIYFLPEYMRKGYGKQLLAAAVDGLASMGYNEVFLWVLEENKNARKFYESQGFVRADGSVETAPGGKTLKEIRYKLNLKEK